MSFPNRLASLVSSGVNSPTGCSVDGLPLVAVGASSLSPHGTSLVVGKRLPQDPS